MEKDWTLLKIDEKARYPDSGVYRVLLYKKGDPVEINRFNGTDPKGILSIGKASNIEKRRNLFQKVSTGSRKRGHSEGVTWKLIQQIKVYERYQLMFEYKPIKSGLETQEESDLLFAYFENYHELPPLNLQFPNRKQHLENEP